jgi:hypothetical protein
MVRERESSSATRASQTRQSRTRRGRGVLFQACEGKAALRGSPQQVEQSSLRLDAPLHSSAFPWPTACCQGFSATAAWRKPQSTALEPA